MTASTHPTFPSDGRLTLTTLGGALLCVGLGGAAAPTVQTPTVFSLADLAFHGNNGVAVGLGGTIVHTADGGAHWEVVTGK